MEPRTKESYQIEIKAPDKAGIVYVPQQLLGEFKKLQHKKDKEQFLKALSVLLIQSGDGNAQTYYLAKIKKEKQANGEDGYTVVFLNQKSKDPLYVERSFTLAQLGMAHDSPLFRKAEASSPEKFPHEVNAKLSALDVVGQAYAMAVQKEAEAKQVIKEREAEKAAAEAAKKAEREAKEQELARIQAEREAALASEARQKERVMKATQERVEKQAAIKKEQAEKESKVAIERAKLRAKLFKEDSPQEKKTEKAIEKRFELESVENPFAQALIAYQRKLTDIDKKMAEIEEKRKLKMEELLRMPPAYDSEELSQRVAREEKKLSTYVRESEESLNTALAENTKLILELKQQEKAALHAARKEFNGIRATVVRAALEHAVSTYTDPIKDKQKFLKEAERLGFKNLFLIDRGHVIVNPEVLSENVAALKINIEQLTARFGAKHAFIKILENNLNEQTDSPLMQFEEKRHRDAIIAIREKAAKSVASMMAQPIDFSLDTYREAVQLHTELYETEKRKLLEIEEYRAAVKTAPESINALLEKHAAVEEEGARLLQQMKLPAGGDLSKELQESLAKMRAAKQKLVELKSEIDQKSAPIFAALASKTINVDIAFEKAGIINDRLRQAEEQDLIIQKAIRSIKNAHLYQTVREVSQIALERQKQKQQENALKEQLEKPQTELYELVKDLLEKNIPYWDKQAITSGGGDPVSFIDDQGRKKKATTPTGVSKMILATREAEEGVASTQEKLVELGKIAEGRVQRKGFLKPIKRTTATKEFYNLAKEFTAANLKDPVKVKQLIQGLKSSQVYQQQQAQLHKPLGKSTK